jgi:hypothetical protein
MNKLILEYNKKYEHKNMLVLTDAQKIKFMKENKNE